jgi:hypothetical protein
VAPGVLGEIQEMSEEPLRIYLEQSFDRDEVLQIRTSFAHDGRVTVLSATRTLGLLPELVSVAPIVGTVISLVNLLITLSARMQSHQKDKMMGLEEFKKRMDTGLAGLGLLDCKLTAIENFEAITGSSGRASVTVATVADEVLKIVVERRGKNLHFSRG